MANILVGRLPEKPIQFMRRCSCVRSFANPVFRHVNIVFKEGAEAPMGCARPDEWAMKECPQCHGSGLVAEEASRRIDVEAMKRDFDRKLACHK